MSRLAALGSRVAAFGGRLAARLDDALNPIVVKELRQAARGRFLAGILIFFLALQLATLGLFLLTKGISSIDLVGGDSYGQEVFGILAGILFFAAVFCVPVYAAVRIYSERAGDQMALFFVSTLAPHRIVAGKLASNLVLSLLLFSACLPYLSFTYYLRGIDLPTVFVALVAGLLISAAAIQGAIFLASLPVSRLLRILIGLGGLGGLTVLFMSSLGVAFTMVDIGVGSQLGSWSFWGPALALGVGGSLLFGLTFFLSVAINTHAAANRARPVRLFALVAWLASGAGAGYACFIHGAEEVAAAWLYLSQVLSAIGLLIAICARDRMSVRVRGEVPRAPGRRLAAFFLFSGSANGVAFSTVMIALTAAVGEVFNRRLGHGLAEPGSQLLGLCAYVFAYALSALLLQRHSLDRWFKRSQTWVLALVLMALGGLAPPIVGFLLVPDALSGSPSFGLWTILNPFSPFQHQVSELATRFALGWAAVMAIFAGGWFIAQARAFRPLDEPPAEALPPAEAALAAPLITDPEGSSG